MHSDARCAAPPSVPREGLLACKLRCGVTKPLAASPRLLLGEGPLPAGSWMPTPAEGPDPGGAEAAPTSEEQQAEGEAGSAPATLPPIGDDPGALAAKLAALSRLPPVCGEAASADRLRESRRRVEPAGRRLLFASG